MTRFAFKFTPEVIDFAAQLTGSDVTDFPEDLFLLVEMPEDDRIRFTAELMSLDEIADEMQKDPALQLV